MIPSSIGRYVESRIRRLGLEPREGRLLALMGTLVAILFCAYTIAKVLRDALFLEEFGALALPWAYIGVALTSAVYVWVEGRVWRRFTNTGARRFNQHVAIVCSILAVLTLSPARHWTAAGFYLWTGAQAMMLLPHFWGLALDIWDSRRARSLFPLLAGCGLIGGLAGGGFAASMAPLLHQAGLMWVLTGLLIIARLLTGALEKHKERFGDMSAPESEASTWEIIRRSGYIKLLTIGIALSVLVGTLVDFQFKLLIQQMYPDPYRLTQFLGAFYAGLNAMSLLFQFGAAGWLLHRFGLGTSTLLQPGAVLAFTVWAAMTSGGWAIVAMRWLQGITSQTVGKTSTEIYYAAIRPKERRRIKAALDTLVERWSDAAVGVMLLIVLRLLNVPLPWIVIGTGVLAMIWLIVGLILDRQFGRSFRETLSRRWIEPEADAESLRLPAARRALLEALRSPDTRQVVLALKLGRNTQDEAIARAIIACLQNPSPAVKEAAIEAMEAMGLPDREQIIEGLLREPHEGVRRAAVRYLVSRGTDSLGFARRLLDGDDPSLRQYLLDALFDHPYEARSVITEDWVDGRMRSGAPEDLLLAARALGAMEGPASARRLATLLGNPDLEIRRAALLSAARRPSPQLLHVLLPLLPVDGLSHEARAAVAALGDAAVPELARMLDGRHGGLAESLAARVLARIASVRAVDCLITQARSGDLRLRHLGLQGLTRVRLRSRRKVLPRATVHRLFLRELRDYRACRAPVTSLAKSPSPEVRLLGESFQESAVRALERALQALACWYDPRPLIGVYDRLKSGDPAFAAPAMEYLGHILPRALFRTVRRIFEEEAVTNPEEDHTADQPGEWIRLAWETGDAWLRACAVRASRCVPEFDRALFATGNDQDPMVRMELEALSDGGGSLPKASPC